MNVEIGTLAIPSLGIIVSNFRHWFFAVWLNGLCFLQVLLEDRGFLSDVTFGKTKIFIRSPSTLFQLEQKRWVTPPPHSVIRLLLYIWIKTTNSPSPLLEATLTGSNHRWQKIYPSSLECALWPNHTTDTAGGASLPMRVPSFKRNPELH